jgi:hypothetical protein
MIVMNAVLSVLVLGGLYALTWLAVRVDPQSRLVLGEVSRRGADGRLAA